MRSVLSKLSILCAVPILIMAITGSIITSHSSEELIDLQSRQLSAGAKGSFRPIDHMRTSLNAIVHPVDDRKG